MRQEKITIKGRLGIHLRPATALSEAALKYTSKIRLLFGENFESHSTCKSVISLLAAGVKQGDTVILTAEGPDEKEALAECVKVLTDSVADEEE